MTSCLPSICLFNKIEDRNISVKIKGVPKHLNLSIIKPYNISVQMSKTHQSFSLIKYIAHIVNMGPKKTSPREMCFRQI